MLLPIGQEDAYIRRLPWVGFVLVAANLVIHLIVTVQVDEVGGRIDRMAWQANEILVHHPNLEVATEHPQLRRAFRWSQRMPALDVDPGEAADGMTDDEAIEELDRIITALEDGFAEHPYFKWGTVPSDLKPHTLLTSMFIHGGWLHLIFNFWLFWILAFSLEDRFGAALFAILYLGSGVVADVTHVAFLADSTAPVVGASGAIAGVMGAFMVRFPKAQIRVWYWFITMGTFVAPAWALLAFWIAEQLFYAVFFSGLFGVAYWAHIGGFAAGVGIALVIKKYGWEPDDEEGTGIDIDPVARPFYFEATKQLGMKQPALALVALGQAEEIDPRSPAIAALAWNTYLRLGEPQRGTHHAVRLLEQSLDHGDIPGAIGRFQELERHGLDPEAPEVELRLANGCLEVDPAVATIILDRYAGEAAPLRHRSMVKVLRERLGLPPIAAAAPEEAPAALPDRPPASAFPALSPASEDDAEQGIALVARRLPVSAVRLAATSADGLTLEGGRTVPLGAISAASAALVSTPEGALVLLDLLVSTPRREVLRLDSRSLDPRQRMQRPDLDPMAAFQLFVERLVQASGARRVPPDLFAEGAVPPRYPDLATYEGAQLAELIER